MLTTTATVLAGLLGAGLVLLGGSALVRPQTLAGFGVHATTSTVMLLTGVCLLL